MLDAKKSEYQKTEKKLMKSVTCLFKSLAAISLAIFVFNVAYRIFLEGEDTSSIGIKTGIAYVGLATLLISFCLHASFFFGILYLTAMYFFQRFEFKRHRARVSTMVFIMASSLLVLFAYGYFVLQI
jgi:hypothetical protein